MHFGGIRVSRHTLGNEGAMPESLNERATHLALMAKRLVILRVISGAAQLWLDNLRSGADLPPSP